MADPNLCTDEEIERLVHAFYADVRQDDLIGPIFNRRVDDWPHHLAKLTDFWSSVLRGSKNFSGSPMAKHSVIDGLEPALFFRWLDLFEVNCRKLPNQDLGVQAYAAAQRIARSLWFGYQIQRTPEVPAADLFEAARESFKA
ncbi:group III truncated hemoglobin [Sinimarinibacterium sp. NLF-5-8]|uniref:group III truncated hemoglobin n=1 Tax=Sinimarinibacterium sp. NLF-5-8 TaxID=2698684 RepID=UPI00137C259C|nr:group III truncated hemoglobin [Sinimarinibacterium sp. NLF-5-8]QHS09207.1 group III truncated hemoglobin [Sinimarinibacterium sp. NLF-5-8]